MRVTLAAIADDGDLLGLDEIEIGIPIVIDAHDGAFRDWNEARLAGLVMKSRAFLTR